MDFRINPSTLIGEKGFLLKCQQLAINIFHKKDNSLDKRYTVVLWKQDLEH